MKGVRNTREVSDKDRILSYTLRHHGTMKCLMKKLMEKERERERERGEKQRKQNEGREESILFLVGSITEFARRGFLLFLS